ncbi:MAG: leucine--tRNA ligase [Candidatus Pacebacteria bacterium]|nr:leucine--tRNA ligase [Candidatus Paceibacterota bacterium]
MQTKIYDHTSIEERWQKTWEERKLFQNMAATVAPGDDWLYLLFAFAYPSGQGLHVGHVESKTALDILARFNRMHGKKVFFPVGWDAFGLPAENYAIKTGVHPAETTRNAIHTFRRQIKRVGISYDWEAEIATSHPGYYKWTQWLFLELYKKGLAYQGDGMVNWCPSCQTVLANEQVVNGACERCETEVIQKKMKQWFFKITDYKDELISGLDQVDWPEATKQQQLHWIGKSEGHEVVWEVVDGAGIPNGKSIKTFTTRLDTIFGVTFIALSVKHDLVGEIRPLGKEAQKYVSEAVIQSESEAKRSGSKNGIDTGTKVKHPITGELIPVWIADFVIGSYGTGAVMGVPGHDGRDNEFAKIHTIKIERAIEGNQENSSDLYEGKGVLTTDFPNFGGLTSEQAIEKIEAEPTYSGVITKTTQYKLRDWLISRQRYWGTPIPIVYDPEGNPHQVKEEHLPWTLPTDVDFKPTGESPLTSSKEFHARVEKLYGKGWRPEYDTMDTFIDSSWYYLRYGSARDETQFADPEQLKALLPVDFYMIGPEHIVLHLLYSRFFTKFLRDQGYLKFDEPFTKMRHQGMIMGPDGKKMSKSKGNVINPDEIIEKFGADTLRVYEMFMGPIESDKPWDISAVAGVYRFLQRTQTALLSQVGEAATPDHPEFLAVRRKLHQTIAKVSSHIPALKFNTAIAALMECLNLFERANRAEKFVLPDGEVRAWTQLIAPFAPFLAEELYQIAVGTTGDEFISVHQSVWPEADAELSAETAFEIPIQIDGKVRARLQIAADQAEDEAFVVAQAQANAVVRRWLAGKKPAIRYIPGKIVSFSTQA